MKTATYISAATAAAFTLFFSIRPVPTADAQAKPIVTVPEVKVTDSLQRVADSLSNNNLRKSVKLISIGKEVKAQSEAISRERHKRTIVQRVEVPVPVCCDSIATVYQAAPTPRRPFLWRIFHKRK